MLVVIVVTAATLLAAFVASYQKQLQTEEAFSHDQGLESLKVLGLVTSLNSAGTAYRNINFTLASEYINPSTILSISINNVPLGSFWWQSFVNHTWYHTLLPQTLTLPSQQEIYVSTNTSVMNNSFLAAAPLPNHYLKFDVYTVLQNDFSRVFLPPAPWAVASEINPSGNNPITVLDGSESFQPGGNASIVNWAWTVTGGFLTDSAGTTISGASLTDNGQSVANGALGTGVVNDTGATATFSVPAGFVYSGGYSVAFAAASSLSATGTGSCGLSGSMITPASTGSVTGTTLTVTFDFTTTISAGCTAATLSLTSDGVMLFFSASGEEYEISPALPVPVSPQSPYVVTLVVTNSDGLVGSMTISYTPPS